MNHTESFPTLSELEYQKLLRKPSGAIRCVIDTAARSEIDDQFALTWALLSQDKLNIEAIYAAPYSYRRRLEELRYVHAMLTTSMTIPEYLVPLVNRYKEQIKRLNALDTDINDDKQIDPQIITMISPGDGMEKSYQEILLVCKKIGIEFSDNVFRGADRYLESYDQPIQSKAVSHLIQTAKATSTDKPLYIIAIGALTNIASALLLAPEIIPNIVVVWTAGYPTSVMNVFQESFNMEQDMLASKLLFDSGVPLIYSPGFHVGAQLRISLPEMEAWVQNKGEIGDYLYELFINNPHHSFQGIGDQFGRTWIIRDLMNFAWLIQPDWVNTFLTDAPYLNDKREWYRMNKPRHLIREAIDINRDAIFRDFFQKLEQASQ